jgi:mannose/fructose/N-acetylgalactosamine-specific phosphotransferase system component IIC
VTLAALMVLGGVVALDATSFGQLMLSRPLIAGTLAGALVGAPLEGALVGALLEALSLTVLPVGAANYPDTGTAAVAAAGTLGLAGVDATAHALLLALVYGLAWQRVAGLTVVAGRYMNERIVRAGQPSRARMDTLIELRHVETMLLDVVRGIAVTAAAVLAGVPLLRLAVAHWALPAPIAAVAVSLAAAAVLAGAAPLFAESPRGRVYLVLGLVCGSLLAFAR